MLAGVVGVEDRGDRLGVCAGGVRLGVVASVERVEIEVLVDGLRAPDAKLVDGLASESHHRNVIGDCKDVLGVDYRVEGAVSLDVGFDMSSESDADGFVGATDLPGIAAGEPFIGNLDLAGIDDLLLGRGRQDTACRCRSPLCPHGSRVEEACGE